MEPPVLLRTSKEWKNFIIEWFALLRSGDEAPGCA
jgi:hypothetical protein